MRHQKRIGAGLLCVILILALLVSSAFIVYETGHNCTGEDCPICQAMALTGQLLRLIGAVILLLAFLPGIRCVKHAWDDTLGFSVPASETLVSWKIRLDN